MHLIACPLGCHRPLSISKTACPRRWKDVQTLCVMQTTYLCMERRSPAWWYIASGHQEIPGGRVWLWMEKNVSSQRRASCSWAIMSQHRVWHETQARSELSKTCPNLLVLTAWKEWWEWPTILVNSWKWNIVNKWCGRSDNNPSSPPVGYTGIFVAYLQLFPARKRGGVLVKFKVYLAFTCETCPYECFIPAARQLQKIRGWRIRPVVPGSLYVSNPDLLTVPSPPMRFWVHRGSMDFSSFCLLDHAVPLASENCTLHLALINARSLANKTFLPNDFFTLWELDFMFLMGTWFHAGELTPFSEFFLPHCNFLRSPQSSGKGCHLYLSPSSTVRRFCWTAASALSCITLRLIFQKLCYVRCFIVVQSLIRILFKTLQAFY